MKNVSKQNLIIGLLILNFVSVLGLFYFANIQNKKIDTLSSDVDHIFTKQEQRKELDSLLLGINK